MNKKSTVSQKEWINPRNSLASKHRGFTLIEIVIAVAIIGIVSIVLYPNIMNSLETRSLENTTRDIMNTIQRAKFQAVKSRINHRVRFDYINQGEMNLWAFLVEREDNPGSWNSMPGFNRRFVPAKFNVTVNFPNDIVQFSPLGFVSNYSTNQNTITIQSSKLNDYSQYVKSQGGE
jgi:prepilin-type N-terminal cleavage/methylation domain-containing protein